MRQTLFAVLSLDNGFSCFAFEMFWHVLEYITKKLLILEKIEALAHRKGIETASERNKWIAASISLLPERIFLRYTESKGDAYGNL